VSREKVHSLPLDGFVLGVENNGRSQDEEQVLGALFPHCLPGVNLTRSDQFPEFHMGNRANSFPVLSVKPTVTVHYSTLRSMDHATRPSVGTHRMKAISLRRQVVSIYSLTVDGKRKGMIFIKEIRAIHAAERVLLQGQERHGHPDEIR